MGGTHRGLGNNGRARWQPCRWGRGRGAGRRLRMAEGEVNMAIRFKMTIQAQRTLAIL